MEDTRDEHYNPQLLSCIRRVPRLLACEAAYYFPSNVDVCSGREHAGNGDTTEQIETNKKWGLVPGLDLAGGGKGEGKDEYKGGEVERRAGNLVLHVRSGDIFDDAVLSYYGQASLLPEACAFVCVGGVGFCTTSCLLAATVAYDTLFSLRRVPRYLCTFVDGDILLSVLSDDAVSTPA